MEKEFISSKFSNLNSLKERFEILRSVTIESASSQNSCSFPNLENFEGTLKTLVTDTLNHNLENFQGKTCSAIDERVSSLNGEFNILEESFSALFKNLKKTDQNIANMNEKWMELINFPTAISKRLQIFGDDLIRTRDAILKMEQNTEARSSENKKYENLERRIGKIEDSIEKILKALNSRN